MLSGYIYPPMTCSVNLQTMFRNHRKLNGLPFHFGAMAAGQAASGLLTFKEPTLLSLTCGTFMSQRFYLGDHEFPQDREQASLPHTPNL